MVTRLILSAAGAAALSACASAPPPSGGPEQGEAAALADLLLSTAELAPDQITAARPEMAALRAALTTPVAVADGPESPQAVLTAPGALEPAPDLAGARSILSAVHLASYRTQQNARAGWRELQAGHGDMLAGLEPRLAEIDLGERGVFLRLKAGPLDTPEAAQALCSRLSQADAWCAPVDFTGDALAGVQ